MSAPDSAACELLRIAPCSAAPDAHRARADLGLLFEILATALDAMFSLDGQLVAGFRFVGHASALPERFAEKSSGSHKPGAHVENHSLETPKALLLVLGRQDHVLTLLQRRRKWG